MIRKFILERRSWIAFIFFLQFLTLFIAFIDDKISFYSVFYIVFLSILLFFLFLLFRFHKETVFYKSLEEREDNFDLTNLATPDSPFEKIIEESITSQTDLLKQEVLQNSMTLEQEKDELLSWIHEVKTPLTALHLMIDRVQDETIKANLTFEWLRIHLLLDQQLHQKRIPFMQNDLYLENLNIETIIFDEIKTLQNWCIQKGIGFDVQLDVAHILSDGKWFAFIIRQILTNSVKYSEESDICIKSFKVQEQTILQIKDSGIGINAKDLPRIFDKGFTSTINHQNNHATGMGLYLAKKVAQSLLIQIDVHSAPQKGTAFTLTFPKKNDFVSIINK